MDKSVTSEIFFTVIGAIITLIAVLYKYSYSYTQKTDKTINENKDIALKDALRIKEEADKEIREMRINYTKKFNDLGAKVEKVEDQMTGQLNALSSKIEHLFASQESNTIRLIERLDDKLMERIDKQDENNREFIKEYLPALDRLKNEQPKPRKRQAVVNGIQ